MIDGARCDCEAHTVLDPTAHHLATACGKYGFRKNTHHDSVVLELQYALQYCGFWIKREERDGFLMADPNDNHIPDLTVMNLTDSVFPQVLLDVPITSPLTGALYGQLENVESRKVAGQQERMARNCFQEKTNKYRARVVANGFGYVPIIFESSGHIHDQSKKFLQASVKKAMETRKIN